MPKEHLTVVEANLSLGEIARALRIAPEDATSKSKDPRVASWFAEIWVKRYLRRFPALRFLPIGSKSVLKLIRTQRLTTSGISPTRFDAWIAETFVVNTMVIDLPVPEPAQVGEDQAQT